MAEKTLFNKLHVTQINRNNWGSMAFQLFCDLNSAQVISLDLEMTGIGRFPRKGDKLDEYYKRLKEVSESKCIINWGLAIFGKPKKDGNSLTYNCQMYNILLVRDTDFSVDPNALDFLCQMGMDMTSVFGTGIRYARRDKCLVSQLWHRILGSGATLAFHNGLVDLVFLYSHFYAALPDTVNEFIVEMADLFQPPDEKETPHQTVIVDSKYLAAKLLCYDYHFLEYVFRKAQRENYTEAKEGRLHVNITFNNIKDKKKQFIKIIELPLSRSFFTKEYNVNDFDKICKYFASGGVCPTRMKCSLIHNVDTVLDQREYEASRRGTKRKSEEREGISNEVNIPFIDEASPSRDFADSQEPGPSIEEKIDLQAHSADIDAFMTGFNCLFAERQNLFDHGRFSREYFGRLFLSFSDHPMIIRHQQHVKVKALRQHTVHLEEINKMRKKRQREDEANNP